MPKSLVISGAPEDLSTALGVRRVPCTASDILALRFTTEYDVVVYWPTKTWNKPLSLEKRSKLCEASGLQYENYLPVSLFYDTKGINSLGHYELTRRAVKAKLLELLLLANRTGLLCIVVADPLVLNDRELARWSYGWICTDLSNSPCMYKSGVHLDLDLPEEGLIGRFIRSLPFGPESCEQILNIPCRGDDWGSYVIERHPESVDLFNEWPGCDLSVELFNPHRNGRGEPLSLLFKTGIGGIVVIPPLLSLEDLLKHVGSEHAIPPAADTATQNLPSFRLTLTPSRQPIRGHGSGYTIRCGDKDKSVTLLTLIRLLAFVVAARSGQEKGINVKSNPKIGDSPIPFIKPQKNPAKVAQSINESLTELCGRTLVEAVPGKGTLGFYRLTVDSESIDCSSLADEKESDIATLLKLLST